MTTPTSMGNHGGTVTSCSPYAYPGFAEICILLRTWSTVAPGTYELAFLIKKKKDEDKRDDAPWTDRKHPDGSDSMDASDCAQVSERFHNLVQALWTLVFSATASYKERYEGTSGSSSTSGSQKESDVRLEEGLSEAGKRLKKAMRRRFKIIDGEEFFEIHKNEWVRTTEDPVGPCKTCKARGEVTRHWVWRCPFLE